MPQLAVFCLLARVSLFQPSHAGLWFSSGLLLAGNGLKSSSMYLGKDLIVFTKTKTTQSIGLLSQTFLEETGMSEVRVPLVCPYIPYGCMPMPLMQLLPPSCCIFEQLHAEHECLCSRHVR